MLRASTPLRLNINPATLLASIQAHAAQTNPAAVPIIKGLPPAVLQTIANAGASAAASGAPVAPVGSPGVSPVVSFPVTGPGSGSGGPVDPGGTGLATAAGWERMGSLSEAGAMSRRQPYPIKILPVSIQTDANGNGTLTWATQEPVLPFRLVVPSGQASLPGYISNITVGDMLLTKASGRIPLSVFSEKTEAGRVDFPHVVAMGEQITGTISGCIAAKELSAVLFCYALGRQRSLPDGATIVGQQWIPFDVTNLAAGASATLNIMPQRNVIVRRVVFDDSAANFSGLYVTSQTVEDVPQTVANQEFPAELYQTTAADDWLDWDVCHRGGTIAIGLRNGGAAAVNAQGMFVCDVISIPGVDG